MIALISNKKIEGYRLEEGAINAKSYLEFLKELFVSEITKGGDTFICNNVAFHDANEVIKFVLNPRLETLLANLHSSVEFYRRIFLISEEKVSRDPAYRKS